MGDCYIGDLQLTLFILLAFANGVVQGRSWPIIKRWWRKGFTWR